MGVVFLSPQEPGGGSCPHVTPFFNPLRPPVLFSIPGATASCMFENIDVFYRVTSTLVTIGLAVSVTNSTFP